MQKKYGLIGFPLSHTFSPGYFKNKFEEQNIQNCSYQSYELAAIDDIETLFQDPFIKGLNVTIPYKEKVIPFLDDLSEEAKRIGAVNTIRIEEGKRVGYNTDVNGFETSLLELLDGVKVKKALILGSGGAAKAVSFVLHNLGVEFSVVSRSKEKYLSYQDLKDNMHNYLLVVNTTPLGMSPKVDTCPEIPYDEIGKNHFFYDLIYNPEKTLFLAQAEANGAKIQNGHRMLIIQAEKSWEIWNRK